MRVIDPGSPLAWAAVAAGTARWIISTILATFSMAVAYNQGQSPGHGVFFYHFIYQQNPTNRSRLEDLTICKAALTGYMKWKIFM